MAAITLRTPADWRGVVDLVRQWAGPMAERGTPLRVLVARKQASRRMALNVFMWAGILDQIAEQTFVGQYRFSAGAFHEFLKQEYLPDTCSKGVEKWSYHGDGTRSLRMSTSDLDDAEFDLYLLSIQAHAAIEWGVVFQDQDEA